MNKYIAWLPLVGAIFLIFSLSACATSKGTDVIKPQLQIPPQMLVCEDSGPRPQGEVIMESEVARYISNLEFSNRDCKTRLKEISIIVKCFNDPKCNVDTLAEYMGLVRETKQK
jgi:hypothetical protein